MMILLIGKSLFFNLLVSCGNVSWMFLQRRYDVHCYMKEESRECSCNVNFWGKHRWVKMVQFKFRMFDFRDNTIHVESTDIVTPLWRQQLVQVLKWPDLSSENGWMQVCWWATRKVPTSNQGLFGGLYCSCMVWSISFSWIFFLQWPNTFVGKLIHKSHLLFTCWLAANSSSSINAS